MQSVTDLGEGPLSTVAVIKDVPLPPQLWVTNVKLTTTSSTSGLITLTEIDLSEEPAFFGYYVEFFKYREEDIDLTNNNYEATSGTALWSFLNSLFTNTWIRLNAKILTSIKTQITL